MSVTNTEKANKISLSQFVWTGFNYSLSVSFIGTMAIVANIKDSKGNYNDESIGLHVFWLFILIAIIAGLCAWTFAKMARVHASNNNGAAYIYTRSAFGRFWGFISAFMLYVLLPFQISVSIFNLMKGIFSSEFTTANSSDYNPYRIFIDWGNFTNLYLDLISIAFYALLSMVIFLGIKWYKRLTVGTGFLKWGTALIFIIAGISLAVKNGSFNFDYWTNPEGGDPLVKNGFGAFVKSFNSCFFFFCGFESFTTAGKNIYQPHRNIGRGIVMIISLMLITYIILMFIFFLGVNSFAQNENMGIWSNFSNIKWIAIGGQVAMIVSQFALKANVSIQNSLYGGTEVEPMALEGYIPKKFGKLNKDNMPVNASLLNMGLAFIVTLLWLIVPDLVQGITKNDTSAFNVSALNQTSSGITLFIYAMVVASMLFLGWQKKVKVNLWEWIVYPVILVFLTIMIGYHYYDLFHQLIVSANNGLGDNDNLKTFTACIVELVFIIVAATFACLWYKLYYKDHILKQRLSTPEGIKEQQILDNEFEPLTLNEIISIMQNEYDEDYLQLLEKYKTRNEKIYAKLENMKIDFNAGKIKDFKKIVKLQNYIDNKQLKQQHHLYKVFSKKDKIGKVARRLALDWK